MNELQLSPNLNTIFKNLDFIDELSLKYSPKCSLNQLATDEGFGFLDNEFGKTNIENRFSKEELLPFLAQIPWEGGSLKVLWWFLKSEVDGLLSPKTKLGFLDLTPVGVFYSAINFNENDNRRSMSRLCGPMLFLLNHKPLRALLELEPREWEVFLRQKNSESVIDSLNNKKLHGLENFTLNDFYQQLRVFKWSLLLELGSRFWVYSKASVELKADSYEAINLDFAKWGRSFTHFIGHNHKLFELVEASIVEGEPQYQIMLKPQLPAESAIFVQAIISGKISNPHLFPMKLVAVE